MLVLTRKTGQKLILNDNIEIVILETRGDAVKIGIKAPKEVTIYREEIYEEIKKANKQASNNVLISDVDKALNLLENKKRPVDDYLSKFSAIITTPQKNKDLNK
ncbi:MAG: carbon storage regulator [Candidatus Melainabacteria bacterium RIFOXYA12_FULL_32_12]|nr:MAG: carbon storage regulator [Candidatus Melainabacteria bacterium GWF2_32_7]OGI21638.1 MAG: carbon storage regulator [Candidatus Melainabacteria bacterium RIFOXYA2_FULL_32_9]OGI30469.1 MAG: carbon storage regulator [Candidatus Melainabacteria bacterium RIFOXYA12_FULL_32_12]